MAADGARRRALLLGLPFALAAGPAFAWDMARTIAPGTPDSRMDEPAWARRHEMKLKQERAEPVELIWIGDSITQQWEAPPFRPVWQHFYGDRHALDLGFGSDVTANVLWRLDNGEIDAIRPKLAILLIGTNDLGRGHRTAADTLAGIVAVVSRLREKLPHTTVLVLGILPSDRSAAITAETDAVNRGLAARYGKAGPAIQYLDVGHVLFTNGALDRSLFVDPAKSPPRRALHPSPAGMRRIAAAIEPTVARIMGDTPH